MSRRVAHSTLLSLSGAVAPALAVAPAFVSNGVILSEAKNLGVASNALRRALLLQCRWL